jgi:hypothetical protein
MSELLHFPDFHSMEEHFRGKKGQFLILVDETHIVVWNPVDIFDTNSNLKYYINKTLGRSY